MDLAHRPMSPPAGRGIAGFVAALSVGRRTGSRATEPGRIRRVRQTPGPLDGPPQGGGPRRGVRTEDATRGPLARDADRRRQVEAELIGLRGPEPEWWSACWRRGLDLDTEPDRLFELVAEPLSDVAVLHDLRAGGSDATIDHVIIGPGGVVVVDSISCPGRVRSDGVHLRVRGKDRSTFVDVALWHAEMVRATLRAHGLDGVPVHGALHWQEPEGLGTRAICLRGIPLLTAGAATGLAANGLVVSPLIAGRVRAVLDGGS